MCRVHRALLSSRGPGSVPSAGGRVAREKRIAPWDRQGSEQERNGEKRVRRNRGGRALRRVSDGDASGPEGLQGPRRRSGDVPQRHDLDAPHPSAGRGGAREMGPARPARGDGMPAHRHVFVRLRALHDLRGPGHRRLPGRVRPATNRARQTARGRRIRGGSRGSGGVHRRGCRHRGRSRHRHPRPRQGRPARHGARSGGHRGGRSSLARREGRGRRAVQREAAAATRATTPTGAGCR